MVIDIMRQGVIPKQELTEKEKRGFSNGTIKEIWLYPESQEGRPIEERHKINIYFSRSMPNRGKFKYGMHLQSNLIPLQKEDILDTSDVMDRSTAIEKIHDISNVKTEYVLIPVKSIEKLKPELITKEKRVLKEIKPHTYSVKTDKNQYALIKIKDSSFNNLVKYAREGDFITGFLALLKYYSPNADMGNRQKLETFFKEGGAYTGEKYNNFIKQNAGEMLSIIENRSVPVEENIGRVLRDRYGVSTPSRKIISLKNFRSLVENMPEENLEKMKEEILRVSRAQS